MPVSESAQTAFALQAAPANAEVLQMLAEYLPARFPDRFSLNGDLMHNHARGETLNLAEPGTNPLELAALLVQVRMTCWAIDFL